MDPFEDHNQEIYQPQPLDNQFPDFNTRFLPQFDEGLKTKTGKNLDKGSDILKKACKFYFCGIALIALIIFMPVILKFLIEFSSWAFEKSGKIFP